MKTWVSKVWDLDQNVMLNLFQHLFKEKGLRIKRDSETSSEWQRNKFRMTGKQVHNYRKDKKLSCWIYFSICLKRRVWKLKEILKQVQNDRKTNLGSQGNKFRMIKNIFF